MQASARRFFPPVDDAVLAAATVATDMFTPRTVERFTGRRNGAIYGSPDKALGGRTSLANLHLCGTDQGLLGIVGVDAERDPDRQPIHPPERLRLRRLCAFLGLRMGLMLSGLWLTIG